MTSDSWRRGSRPTTTRLHPALKRQLKNYADELGMTQSDVLRDAVKILLDRQGELEVDNEVKEVLKDNHMVRDMENKDFVLEESNFIAKTDYKEKATLNFMLENLVALHESVKPFFTEEKTERILLDHIEKYRHRVQLAGLEGYVQEIKENPIEYIEQRKAQKKTHKSLYGEDLTDRFDG